jgi:integrase
MLLGDLKPKSEYVFPSPKTGGKLDNIKRSFRRAVTEAGIEDFRFHDLRHTAATRMADAGADGGVEEGRTPDLCIANAALCQTELLPRNPEFQ